MMLPGAKPPPYRLRAPSLMPTCACLSPKTLSFCRSFSFVGDFLQPFLFVYTVLHEIFRSYIDEIHLFVFFSVTFFCLPTVFSSFFFTGFFATIAVFDSSNGQFTTAMRERCRCCRSSPPASSSSRCTSPTSTCSRKGSPPGLRTQSRSPTLLKRPRSFKR